MSAPRTQAPLTGGYDQSLLAAAPEATKAAKQEGYNVDLLDEGRHRSQQPHSKDVEPAYPTEPYNGMPGGVAAPPSRKIPFWRTRQGIIGIVILAVIIVGAVVGGAVGGSVAHHGNKNTVLPSPTTPLLPGETPSTTTGTNSSTSSGTSATSPPGQQTAAGSSSTAAAGQQVQSGQDQLKLPGVPTSSPGPAQAAIDALPTPSPGQL